MKMGKDMGEVKTQLHIKVDLHYKQRFRNSSIPKHFTENNIYALKQVKQRGRLGRGSLQGNM
jgi:hypothetical protein